MKRTTLAGKYLSLKVTDPKNELLKYGHINEEGKFRFVDNDALIIEFLDRFQRNYKGANLPVAVAEMKTLVSAIINYEGALEREVGGM